ncbi:uncharacterized protein LOC114870938 [Osmia bicornis bicornis]|uniref:uncharacterized protein LOC114870938 n=1 Tax=Osmia bicornis bicornis TaxID=1437191 RepID=UPI0010F9DB7F|nr:uncharacterized protein LOC114870938 [Osmia bicornis bicornis]
MKILWLLLFVTWMMITMETDEIFAKEQKGILKELSNAISNKVDRSNREKQINKGFEWILQCVNVLGQVDNFISDRTKNIVHKLHIIYNDNNEDTYRNLN